jgi:RNA polymerase sigma-70 factor (ECF subfamily)
MLIWLSISIGFIDLTSSNWVYKTLRSRHRDICHVHPRGALFNGMERETELRIVERLRAGDRAAFDEVHAAFNDRLFTFLVRLSCRRDVAEDLLEETWLRLVTHAGRLSPETTLGPWLFTVARNLHVSYLRSRLLEDTSSAGLVGLWPYGVQRSSPFEETAASELERRVERALASLPSGAREVLLLVATAGLSPAEAAATCRISPEAFRQRLSRARAQLSRALEAAPPVPAAGRCEVIP